MPLSERHMTAAEACALLGIRAETLYAYVSRGLIRSESGGTTKRERHYHGEDVRRLAERKAQRRNPARAAQTALKWGAPVLSSALTLIKDGRLYYRGHDAARLAHERTFEEVAALLWTGDFAADALFTPSDIPLQPTHPALPTLEAMQVALIHAATADPHAHDLRPDAVIHTGARILRLLTDILARSAQLQQDTSAHRLAAAWRTPYIRLLDAALILCADHELNASSFAARVVASTEATPYAAVIAGLAALSGGLHGGMTRQVAALLCWIDASGDPRAVIDEHLRQSKDIPGFGHKLYPDGDPRAAALMQLLREECEGSPLLARAEDVARAVTEATGGAPTIDFALVTLERALALPEGAALALFALGRAAGWIAHTIEQYENGTLIRPRALYTGVAQGS